MSDLVEFKFNSIYELADLVDSAVKAEIEFWNHNHNYFIESATRFSKNTLLHQYIVVTAMNHYRRDFLKNGDCIEECSIESWYALFKSHLISIKKCNFKRDDGAIIWFNDNENKFEELFCKMANEAFYILFGNRKFLLDFNKLVSFAIKGEDPSGDCLHSDQFPKLKIPKRYLTHKGTIKRKAIPQWVKKAVFHRDKGRCVFCNTDLTDLVNTLTTKNYDHIVPLDKYGANDPSNIQLTCWKHNNLKRNRAGSTSRKYIPWWPK